ncbi:hypothetical protein [Thalassoglobus polymorphus]|uniref:Uncharacterized protein n=1 Tax=Thalassoglobus polymorphus TaxID=2527994 RepID=A0A517QVH4_9PLAN|nr:hypothetical protein [Thalassoglobus polymorphus]QDT35632.1 hypothetical protein Mal48_49100 [Thalassoglobus polymorphus]
MGFLKPNNAKSIREDSSAQSARHSASSTQLEEHLKIARYGSYLLTDAVRPAFDLKVIPGAGWRKDVYRDAETEIDVPVIMASQTREKLFDLFMDLLVPLGDEVDVVLETSHDSSLGKHDDLYRESIELPILKSMLYDYEDVLTNDGCTGIAVLNAQVPMEVQFDEHKLLMMYGHDLDPFIEVLESHGLYQSDTIRFITEAEHIHSSTEEHIEQFNELRYQLGVEFS